MAKRLGFLTLWMGVGSLLGQFVDDFNTGSSANWVPKNPVRWSVGLEYGRTAYYINTTDYSSETPDKLGEYALVRDRVYADFSFSCLTRSRETFAENTAADFAVVFGYQNNANYYYMLFNRWASETKLYKVQSDSRVLIAEAESCWILDNEYRIVEVVRSGGMISVKYDGRLVLTAYDVTFLSGGIGIGSYNDAAAFDDVRISESPIAFDRWIRLTPITPLFSLTDPGAHKKIRPAIDVGSEGKIVITWQEATGKQLWTTWRDVYAIYARVFSQKGSPLTDALRINSGFYGLSPALAAGPDRFLVSWTDFPISFPFLDDGRGLTVRQVSLTGTFLSTHGVSYSPGGWLKTITDLTTSSLVYLGSGQFNLVWNERAFSSYFYDIYGTSRTPVNTVTESNQMHPSITADGFGRMLVTWDSDHTTPAAIFGQALSTSLGRVGENFQVNQSTTSIAKWNALSSNKNGKAFVSWTREEGVIAGRRCKTDGTFQGDEVSIGNGTGRSHVSVNRFGQACVVWETTEEGPSQILARIMWEDGSWFPGSFHLHPASSAWHFPRIVFWENCLYTAFESRQDSTIRIGVFLVDHPPLNYTPYLVSTRQDTAIEDQPYTYVSRSLDPNGDPVSFSFDSYPHWLSPADGSISGTPREGDRDTSFIVISSDGSSSTQAQIFLTVIPVNDPPRFVSPDSVVALTDSAFTYTAQAVDEENDPLVYTFSDYPAWLSPSDSVISGLVPPDAHDFSFTVWVSDGKLADTLIVRVRTTPVNVPPRITGLKDLSFSETETFTILLDTCAVDDGPVESLAWKAHPEKDSLLVSWEDRRVTLSSSGWHGQSGVLFTVTDLQGASDSLRIEVRVLKTSGIAGTRPLPDAIRLHPVYPNPFNPRVLIRYDLPAETKCLVGVYNLKGERIEALYRGHQAAGSHTLIWNASACPAGTYLVRLQAGGVIKAQKALLVK